MIVDYDQAVEIVLDGDGFVIEAGDYVYVIELKEGIYIVTTTKKIRPSEFVGKSVSYLVGVPYIKSVWPVDAIALRG